MKNLSRQEKNECGESPNSQRLTRLAGLIADIWALTSDFEISEESAFARAKVWDDFFKGELLKDESAERDPRVRYTLKVVSSERQWRGAIHADEFYRTWRHVIAGGAFCPVAGGKKEWIPLRSTEHLDRTINSDPELQARWYKQGFAGPLGETTPEREAIIAEAERRFYEQF